VASTAGAGARAGGTGLASFQSRELTPGEGAFVMALDAASGAVQWVTQRPAALSCRQRSCLGSSEACCTNTGRHQLQENLVVQAGR